jgi:primosomal protein N'
MRRAEAGEIDQGIIDNLLEVSSENEIWNEGAESQVEKEIDLDSIPTQKMNLVLNSDSTQEEAIIAAQDNECTVVRGPPGTGKSQAIVNIIANALVDNKKVLLVCQKRAALDVVHQRLAFHVHVEY